MDQLRALRVFARVVAEGSFAGAARALDMAPAVVTRTVAELESHLGARLLNRTTRRVALTETGAGYLDAARQILTDLDDADALAGAATTIARGSLRVLSPPAFAVHQLAQWLPDFHARYPEVSIELSMPGPVDAADENFDVSIVSIGQQPLQGDFIARRLARSTFVICAAPAYLARHGRPNSPDDLLQHRGLLPAVSAVRRELTLFRDEQPGPQKGPRRSGSQKQGTPAAAAHKATIPTPPSVLTTTNLDMLRAAAIAGLGVAGLPSFVVADALIDGRLERVLPQWHGISLTLYAAMPTRKHVPARTRAFVDFLVQCFGGADKDPWLR